MTMKSGQLLVVALISCADVTMAPVIEAPDLNAISAGELLRVRLQGGQGVLDVVAPSAVEGDVDPPCSDEDPCWVVATELLAGITAANGEALQSVRSRELLANRARGKGMAGVAGVPPGKLQLSESTLIDPNLLSVLWAVDPGSFFFVYMKPGTSDQLTAVLPPSAHDLSVARIPEKATVELSKAVGRGDRPADEMLPDKVKKSDLHLVLRRSGLYLLLCDAKHENGPMAHSLRGELGDVHRNARAWPHVPRATRASARAALVQCGAPASLLELFDNHLPAKKNVAAAGGSGNAGNGAPGGSGDEFLERADDEEELVETDGEADTGDGADEEQQRRKAQAEQVERDQATSDRLGAALAVTALAITTYAASRKKKPDRVRVGCMKPTLAKAQGIAQPQHGDCVLYFDSVNKQRFSLEVREEHAPQRARRLSLLSSSACSLSPLSILLQR